MKSDPHRQEKLLFIVCWMSGMLAILPYLIWMILYYFDRGESISSGIAQVALGFALIIAPCNGLIFGAVGLGIGLILFFRRGGRYYARRFSVILPCMLLSVIGLVLDLWWWYIILQPA